MANDNDICFFPQLIAHMPCSRNCTLQNGWTPLHVASLEGHKDIAQLLLEHGAGVNTVNNVRRSYIADAFAV